jgi:hypothetical protein
MMHWSTREILIASRHAELVAEAERHRMARQAGQAARTHPRAAARSRWLIVLRRPGASSRPVQRSGREPLGSGVAGMPEPS